MESEQIFESTQETAYRLCYLDSSNHFSSNSSNIFETHSKEQIFSTQWDPNHRNRLFVCTQLGKLHVCDFETGVSSRYQVFFQPFSTSSTEFLYDPSDDQSNDERKKKKKTKEEDTTTTKKKITYHWDKLSLLPNRPNELMFLLGISRNVMYSSLPIPTLIHSTTPGHLNLHQRDVSDFVHGSPVVELLAHKSRVTSMVISGYGQVLASGDENGNVKLLSLQLLNLLSQTNYDIHSSKPSVSSTSKHSMKLPNYKLSRRIHEGSIFSMIWLFSFHSSYNQKNNDISSDESRHCLITGSNDRSVQLWTVTSSSESGIQLIPLLTLSTISANILSMTSLLFHDDEIHQINQLTIQSMNILSNDTKSIQALSLPSPLSYYIAIGTHLGTVYVWRINKDEILSAMNNATMLLEVDDGRYLHSLLPSCDRPIITISLSISNLSWIAINDMDSKQSRSKRVVMSISDTLSSMKLHYEANAVPNIQPIPGTRQGFGPISFFKEINYDSLVVSSSFLNESNRIFSKGSQVSENEDDEDDDKKKKLPEARLFVITMDGEIRTLGI